MSPIEVTLLTIWLSGLGIGWIIGVYQSVQMDYNQTDDEKEHGVLWFAGSIVWPLVGYACFLVELHRRFKEITK